jgi:hypothetical protein
MFRKLLMVKSYLIKFVALSQSISVLFFSIVVAILCFVRLKINLKIVLSSKKKKKQTNKNKHIFEIGQGIFVTVVLGIKNESLSLLAKTHRK